MEVGSIIETAGNLKMMIFNMGISLWIADRFQDSPYSKRKPPLYVFFSWHDWEDLGRYLRR